MVATLGNWKFWVYVAFIGLAMSLTVRIIAEAVQGESRNHDYLVGQIEALDKRITKLETSTHPSTMKRYTSEDAAHDKAAIYLEIGKLRQQMRELHESKKATN